MTIADLLLPPDAPVKRAAQILDASRAHIALVVDGDGRLLGTVTDGDVRRGLLRGASVETPVAEVMAARPVTAPEGTTREAAVALMRRKAILQLPLLDAGGRVVALELLERDETAADTWVVLMVGGEGRRLRPLTDDVPKPLLPVGGQPLAETILRRFADQGFRRVFLSVNYKAELFRRHFGDGAALGIELDYLEETEPRGTAGSLALLPGKPPGPVIVMNGDLLTSVDFRHLLDFHRDGGAAATLCVREYALQVPYGVARLEGQRLLALDEKPSESVFVNAGIYVLSPEALARIPASGFYHMTTLLQDLVRDGREVAACPLREYWLDIGRLEDLERAQDEYKQVFG